MKQKQLTRALMGLGVAGSLLLSSGLGYGAGFQLYEQDSADMGDYHAGMAAEADSAATGWYNPAGLTRLKSMQISTGVAAIGASVPFKGTVEVNTVNPGNPQQVRAQGGQWNYVPNFHFATPINQNWAFGLGVTVPFGLQTRYGNNTFLKYAATTTQVRVVDISSDLAYQVNKVMSLGVGLDLQRMSGVFNQFAGLGTGLDTKSNNSGFDWGLGYHLGALFQFTPKTRVGVAYHSQVVHHLKGRSKFVGPLANGLAGGVQTSDDLKAKVTLPAYITAGFYHDFNQHWAVLGSARYTWWSVFKKLRLQNISVINTNVLPPQANNNAEVVIPEHYKNTWNFSLGVHYTPIKPLTFKAGVGYDQTPSSDTHRNVQLPGESRYALAFGVHYQLLKNLGVDVGYTHLFIQDAHINVTQQVSSQEITTVGKTKSFANLYGLQLEWKFPNS